MSFYESSSYLFPFFNVQDAFFRPNPSWLSYCAAPRLQALNSNKILNGEPAKTQRARQPLRPFHSTPNYQLVQQENGYLLSIDVPGVAPEEIKVEVRGNILTVSKLPPAGEKKTPSEAINQEAAQSDSDSDDSAALHSDGNTSAQVRWNFKLGREIDGRHISGTLKYGVLDIHLPRIPEPEPKRIEIAVL